MIDKVQYSDYNRFLVSVGIILIAIGLILPYFYSKETFELLLKKEEVELLTDTAKEIIGARQRYARIFIEVVPWLAAAALVAGIGLMTIGLLKWRKRQQLEDRKLVLENEKIAAELAKMNAETDILKKGEKIPQARVVENKQREIEKLAPGLSSTEKELAVSNYIMIESLIAEKFRLEFSDRFNVFSNYRVNNREFDIILTPIRKNIAKIELRKDVIVEVKYARKITETIVRNTILQTGERIKSYPNAVTNPVVLFVSEEREDFDKKLLLGAITSEWSEKTVSKWRVEFISARDLPIVKLKELLDI